MPDLDDLLKKALDAYNALPSEKQREMREAQLQSWARGEAGLDRDPAGKCGELVTAMTVLVEDRAGAGTCAEIQDISTNERGLIELVTRSQAEELLAARDRKAEEFDEQIKEAAYEVWPDAEDVGSDAPDIIRQLGQERDKLEAENAAQAVRIKELEELVERTDGFAKKYLRHMKNTDQRNEALEAKLAAASRNVESAILALSFEDADEPVKWKDIRRAFAHVARATLENKS